MVRRGESAGVAVSGGADSVCLLHALARLAPELGIRLHVLHLNHGLRGAESDEDERFVAELAGSLGLPLHAGRAEGLTGHGNLEQAAREARLAFFRQAMGTLGLTRVATGHTLSDQAETVLFRASRGTGAAGLRGIQPVTGEGLVRPLIEVTRAEARAWLKAEGLEWREDSSNLDTRLTRNFLRQEVLPRLAEAVNPQVEAALGRLAAGAAEDEGYWAAVVEGEMAAMRAEGPPGTVVLEAPRLAACHPALGKRIVRRALEEAAGSLRRLTQEHVEAAWRLTRQKGGTGSVRLPRAEVRRSMKWLLFGPAGKRAEAPPAVELAGPGRARTGAWTVEVNEWEEVSESALAAGLSRYNGGSDLLDAEQASFPLTVRCWQAGDAYRPAGRGGEVKVKELFALAGVPSWDRPLWPMILSAGRIVWCRRFGSAAQAAAGPGSGRVLRVREVSESSSFETSAGRRRGE